jgi:sulfate adenylyltransferase
MSEDVCVLEIGIESWMEISNIAHGVFSPLNGFMDSKDYHSVVENMHLANGSPWTIPITLDAPENRLQEIMKSEKIALKAIGNSQIIIAEIEIIDVFPIDFENDSKKIFGTDEMTHPGVKKEFQRSKFRVGGAVIMRNDMDHDFPDIDFTPKQTKKYFKDSNWKTVVGFQTRNPLHRAHEYLQRVGLEVADGLFIQPLLGWKKEGDFTPEAVVSAYQKMMKEYYPANRVLLGTLMTPMRYAGPREAVFHAIIRKNFGCSHFIVGRDHAGVGNYYGKYAAHQLCSEFTDLGIEILQLHGPYYCGKCQGIVTEKSCCHGDEHTFELSGTEVRKLLAGGERPNDNYMRREISDILIDLSKGNKLFIKGN